MIDNLNEERLINVYENIESIPIIFADNLIEETVTTEKIFPENSNNEIMQDINENLIYNQVSPENFCAEEIQPICQEQIGSSCLKEASLPSTSFVQNVPVPFQKALFWPGASSSKKKKNLKEKVPAVVSSEQWQLYYKLKEEKKNKKQAAIEERKRKRAEVSKQKHNEKEEKKRIRILAAEERKKKIEEKKKQKSISENKRKKN